MVTVYAYVRLIIVIVVASLLISFGTQHHNVALIGSVVPQKFQTTRDEGNSLHSIRFINASSLKCLPAVIKDLSVAINEPAIQGQVFSGMNGFAIYLYDVTCNSFEHSAAVRYVVGDTVYHLKLNRFNRHATDKALATTLIHEIMHCVLLDIDKRAKQRDQQAIVTIAGFGLNRNDTSNFFNNDFFVLMNRGDAGQHELMYQLFYPQMVSLLKRFAEIHGGSFSNYEECERLMWSGLQGTSAYKKLEAEERRDIERTILKTKGVDVNIEDE
jgi:hypothetical protein